MSMGRDFPDQIAQYQLKEVLGEGGFGIVYRAWDSVLETHVAVKFPKLGDLNEKQSHQLIARFLREARAAARLPPHTNLCPVREVGKYRGQHYVVLAFIQGKTLSAVNRSLEIDEVLRLVRKIARAMQVAHDNDVVHRDLKPANIMLVDDHQPVVMDFGLALRIDVEETDKTEAGNVMGTPAYMSPEQIEGRPNRVGPRSDIYSLGIILYELLTGHKPYEGTLVQIVGKIIKGEAYLPPSQWNPAIPNDVEAVCLKAMAWKMADRFQSMNEFALALTDCLSRASAEVPPLPPGPDSATQVCPLPNQAPFDRGVAWDSQERWAKYLGGPVQRTNAIQLDLMLIPPGEFWMGSPETELERSEEEFSHRVLISEPFYLGAYPVTQAEYAKVMGCAPSQFNKETLGHETGRFPVEMVSWYDCLDFCNKLQRTGRAATLLFPDSRR